MGAIRVLVAGGQALRYPGRMPECMSGVAILLYAVLEGLPRVAHTALSKGAEHAA